MEKQKLSICAIYGCIFLYNVGYGKGEFEMFTMRLNHRKIIRGIRNGFVCLDLVYYMYRKPSDMHYFKCKDTSSLEKYINVQYTNGKKSQKESVFVCLKRNELPPDVWENFIFLSLVM